jgi:CxxC motif-containing protein
MPVTTAITHYLCIGCPLGCRLEVEDDQEGTIVEIRGFACKRGEEYARQEHTDPRRFVTTTVTVVNGMWPRLPVKTAAPIPKESVPEVCEALRDVSVTAPVKMGDIILSHVLGTDVIASRDMPAVE